MSNSQPAVPVLPTKSGCSLASTRFSTKMSKTFGRYERLCTGLADTI